MKYTNDILFIFFFLFISFLIGVAGFRSFCGCGWYDSLCSTSMALGCNYTMTKGEKGLLFCSLFSLYGRLIFIAIIAIVVAKIYDDIKSCGYN